MTNHVHLLLTPRKAEAGLGKWGQTRHIERGNKGVRPSCHSVKLLTPLKKVQTRTALTEAQLPLFQRARSHTPLPQIMNQLAVLERLGQVQGQLLAQQQTAKQQAPYQGQTNASH